MDHKHKGYCIVKRGTGDCERYDERKVYGSVYAACYVVRRRERECEKAANRIAKKMSRLVRKKKKIASSVIARTVASELRKYDVHAAFMYETHRDVS